MGYTVEELIERMKKLIMNNGGQIDQVKVVFSTSEDHIEDIFYAEFIDGQIVLK